MSVKEVLRMGNPLLAHVAQPVEDATAEEIQSLIIDLREPCMPGIGLAWRRRTSGAPGEW